MVVAVETTVVVSVVGCVVVAVDVAVDAAVVDAVDVAVTVGVVDAVDVMVVLGLVACCTSVSPTKVWSAPNSPAVFEPKSSIVVDTTAPI